MVFPILFVGVVSTIQAQSYIRSTFNAPFVPITIGGGATLSTASGDGVLQTGIPIGFTFNHYGVSYSTIAVSTDGFASFTATANSLTNTNLYTTTAPNAVIAPWWDDLNSSEILYQTTGAPGSQVFTVQWTSLSYWTGSTRNIYYQIKLYEGTDVIELYYSQQPLVGTPSSSESASIGISSATGGPGNYIDAVTGSSFVNNSMMNSNKWPKLNFRFTPGIATPIVSGIYNVGIGQTFNTLWEAVAEINHRGSTGPVSFVLTDMLYDSSAAGGYNMFPVAIAPSASSGANPLTINGNTTATVAWYGSTSGNIGNAASTAALTTTTEPIIAIVGADFVTLTGINFYGTYPSSPNRVDRAISIINVSATDGAQSNIISDVNITLDRTNTSSIGIQANVVTTPTSAAGANSNNIIRNFSIENVYAGVNLNGNATYPDLNNMITNSVCTNFNSIGNPATPNDIGNGSVATYGIYLNNQSDFTVSNNRISNVTNTGGQADGINILLFKGICHVNNNLIRNVRNAGTASTTVIAGIRVTHTTTGTHSIRIFNNAISDIISAYSGAASATRVIRGINIAGTGGATTQTYEIFNNSVSIDGSASPNISSVCLEISTTTGPVYTIANNSLANFTAAQSGVARHFVYRSTSATSFGNTGTILNNNNVFILNDVGTTGFIGQGNTVDYPTLNDWQIAMSLDAASLSVDPNYINNSNDLHATNLLLNNAGMAYPPYITQDLDCAPRVPDNDIGAYVLTLCSGTPTAGSITGVNGVCDGFGTTLTLSGASAEAGITYQWAVSSVTGGPYSNLGTSGTQPTGVLSTDSYYIVTVTCSNSGLSATTAEKSIVVYPNPNVSVSPTTTLYCNPGAAANLSASGANTFSWSPSSGLSATTGSSVDASPLTTTTYTVVGTDLNGCTASATVLVNSGPTPSITSVTASPSAICEGDDSQLNVTGNSNIQTPINNYSFSYSTGASLQDMTGATIAVANSVDDTPSALQSIGFTFNYEGVPYTQFSASPDGFIKLGAPAATNQFTNNITSTTNIPKVYPYWDDLATGTDGNVRYLVTGTPGNQILVVEWFVTIPRNTTGPANSTFQIWLYEATGVIEMRYGNMNTAVMSASVGATGATATNYQSITVTSNTASTTVANNSVSDQPVLGAMYTLTPPPTTLTYQWTPSTYLNNTTIDNPLAQNVINPTIYDVTITNGSGCTASGSAAVTIHPVMTPSLSVTDVTCLGNDGAIDLTVVGGTSPFAFLWSNGATSEDISGIGLGTYTVTITDDNLCSSTVSATVVNQGGFVVNGIVSDLSCFGGSDGSVDITVSGGVLPYASYLWSHGATTEDVALLPAGPYTVTVTDDAGCTTSNTFVLNEPTPVMVNMNVIDIDCFGNNNGSIDLTPSGGVGGYGFLWSTTDITEDISNLSPGWYYITVTDANLCAKYDSAFVAEPAALSSSILPTHVTCFGNNDGIADLTPGGGTGTLTFTWSNGAFTEDISPLAPGTYTVTILDANGCSLVDSTDITEPLAALTATISSTNVLCYGESSGTGIATPDGGTAPYTYLWTGGATDSIANFPIGSYSVLITDYNGCTTTGSITLTQPLLLTANITTSSDVSCNGANDGTATVIAGYGTPGYTYLWSNSNNTDIASGLGGGTYTVVVTDDNGCTASDQVTINEPAAITAPALISNEIWGNDGYIDITPAGGVAPYTFDWSNGATTEDIGNLAGGTYTVTVTDDNLCTETFVFTVVSQLGLNGIEAGIGEVNFYPNPSNGQFTVSIAGFAGKDIQMQIFDLSGKMVFANLFEQPAQSFASTVDLRHLSMGTYVVRLTSETGTLTGRIVIAQ